jgi:hypothetical protein
LLDPSNSDQAVAKEKENREKGPVSQKTFDFFHLKGIRRE